MIAAALNAIPDEWFALVSHAHVALMVSGAFVAGLGVAGRATGWVPRCAACGFDLRAMAAGTPRCPECGAALSGKRAVSYGLRTRRWGLVVLGLLMVGGGVVLRQTGASTDLMDWRDRVIANAVPLEDVLDEVARNNVAAVKEVLAEVNGSGRRVRAGVFQNSPANEPVNAVLARMEKDAAVRHVLLPAMLDQATGFPAVARLSSRSLSVGERLLNMAADEILATPDAADRIPGPPLAELKRFGHQPAAAAFDRLLSSEAFVRSLYVDDGTPIALATAPIATVRLQPKRGQNWPPSAFHRVLFTHVRSARWRPAGGSDADWRPVSRPRIELDGVVRVLQIRDPPESGRIEVEAECVITAGSKAEIECARNRQSSGEVLPARGVEVIWRRTCDLRSREALELAAYGGPESSALWALASSQMIVKAMDAKDVYELADAEPRVDETPSGPVWLGIKAVLAQGDKRWEFKPELTTVHARLRVRAPGFDAKKPFIVEVHPDLTLLRQHIMGDSRYLDVHCELEFPEAGVVATSSKVIDPR